MNVKKPLRILIVLMAVLTALPLSALPKTLHFSFQNGSGKRGVTYAYPLMMDDSVLTSDSLLSGQFTVAHDGTVFDIVGVQQIGTMLGPVSNVQFNPATRTISFAATTPITGKGIFVELLVAVKANAAGSSVTSLQNILLNEGSLTGAITNGSMRPMDILIAPKNPPQDRIVGDTIPFSVSGDLHPPMTWSVSDTHVVSINTTGRAIGKNVGQTTVTVTDAIGLTSQSGLLPIRPATLRSLTVSTPNISVMQNLTFLLPVKVSTVTGLGITSAQFRLTYNTSLLIPLGVEPAGSMTASWAVPTVNYGSNYLDVALAGTQVLSDSGALVFVRFKVKRSANFSDLVSLTNVLFNEMLNAAVVNGLFTPTPGPVISVLGKPSDLIIGQTVVLGASGGSSPYRWKMLGDTAIAVIDSVTGLLTAKKHGVASFAAVDVNGFDRAESLMVTDVRFLFPDTSFIYTDSIDYPVSVTTLSGYSILAAQMVLPYDSAKLRFVGIQRSGTLTSAMTMEVKDSVGIRIALSGVTPLSGAGPFLKFRFRSKGISTIGGTVPLSFSQVQLNESGASVRTASQRTGTLGVTNIPNYPPVFTAKLRDTTISENQQIQIQLAATDLNNDSLLFGLYSASAGMSMSPKGLFFWTPNFSQAGTHKVVYEVGDYHPNGVTRDSAVITVLDVNRPPQITRPMNDTSIASGQSLSFDIDAIDPDFGTVKFSLAGASPGMKIDSLSGLFTWTPTNTQTGFHTMTVIVMDSKGAVTTDPVTITVTNGNRAPVFTRVFTDTTITEDQQLTFTVKATDADGDIIRYFIQNIRPGMNIDTITGVLNWRPTFQQAGTHNIIFIANDGKGGNTALPSVITVTNVNRPPMFSSLPTDTVIVNAGNTVNAQLNGVDPDNDVLSFAIVEGPAGATLTTSGLLAWTPTTSQIGTHRFIFSVSDGTLSAQDTVYARVLLGYTPPVFVRTLPDTSIAEGQVLQYQYLDLHDLQDTIVWELQTDAKGMLLSPNGLLSWTPGFDQAGNYRVIVRINDRRITVTDTAAIVVTNTNRAPRFSSDLRDTTVLADSLIIAQLSASDPDGDPITYSAVKSPAGMTVSATGLLQWRPFLIRRDTVILRVSDASLSSVDTAIVTVTGFPSLHVSATELDFGTTPFGARPVQTVIIRNSGRVPLQLERMKGLPNEQHFTIGIPSVLTVAPQESVIVPFTYTPTQIGAQVSGAAFRTNDPRQQFLSFTMRGTAISVAPVKRSVLVDLFHAPRFALKDSLTGMTQLFNALRVSGIDVAFAETTFTPKGYDAVLLVSPQKSFSDAEKSDLRRFITDGGLAVLMESAQPETKPFAINELLTDSLLGSGMQYLNSALRDTLAPYGGDAASPVITKFADGGHPYLRGVDSLVFFNGAMVMTDSTAVPFAVTAALQDTAVTHGRTAAAAGLKRVGKGTLLVLGTTNLWRNARTIDEFLPFNIAAKDNFTFALNVFSTEEDYALALPSKTPSEVYQLISIPVDVKDAEVLALLKANLGEINPLKWRLFGRYDAAKAKYSEFPSDGFTSFKRGEAYWLITRGEFSMNFGSATVTPAQDYFSITIPPGYSMIGNPFPYTVSWQRSRRGDSVQTVLWRFDLNSMSFQPESLSLAPFTGYFVKNLSADSVTIAIDPTPFGLPKQGSAPWVADAEWSVRIGAAHGRAADDENYAGVAADAREELDRHDIGEPPTTPTDYVRVRFNNAGWKSHAGSYAADIRPMDQKGMYWDFDVTTSKPSGPVQLSLQSFGNIPSGFDLYLVDMVSERVTRFDRSLTIEYQQGRNALVHPFRLVAGGKEYAEKNANGIPLVAMSHELGQNYPNPFNPSTMIHYTIGHSGVVTLEVFNVLGQRVRLLHSGFHAIGSYQMEWDAKDDHGATVSSGVYFSKLSVTANGEKLFTETRKMVLMK